MSLRMKRQATKPDDPGGYVSKRKRRKLSGSEDAADSVTLAGGASSALLMGAAAGLWTPRHLGDLKAYNKKSTEKPGELIRKDLISAMKLPDSEYLSPDEYFEISDQWKQEWERGVQVPVNPDRLPHPKVSSLPAAPHHTQHDFRMPKKLVRVVHDDDYNPDLHHMSNAPARAEKSCRYDLDQLDSAWLHILNGERARMGLPMVIDLDMERAVENMERQCWSKIQQIVKTHEGLSIEFDENVVCDVCQLPDSEEDNEMVFCDKCNICVHQTCYGITSIPDGSWLCKTCTLAIKPDCVLCPNKGGAMKSTRSGHKWAHVSCALWIPEVSIGDVEKMEPITKISNISARRWALVCVLCKEKIGACIQCSVKSCKTAYHVTCAFKHNLKMKPVEDESEEDEIKLKSYCQKHSKDEKLGADSDSEPGSTRHDPDFEAKKRTRKQKLQQIESEFYKHVDQREVSACCSMPLEAVDFIYNYWKLKRKSVHNKPLLPPAPDVMDARTEQQKQDLERIKQFVHIRQNLEKVRNLCYMVTKRQKQLRNYFRLREQTLSGQAAVLRCRRVPLLEAQRNAVLHAGRCTDNVYDRHYSQSGADASAGFTVLRLTELLRGKGSAAGDVNGLVRGPDPYKRRYVNGAERRRSQLPSSASDSDTTGRQRDDGRDTPSLPARPRITKQSLFGQDSSESGADSAGAAASCRRRAGSVERIRQKCGRPRTRPADHQPTWPASDDSDNKPLRVSAVAPHVLSTPARHIYTDSEEESVMTRATAATAAAGAGSSVRTKAAMKAFSHHAPLAADPTDPRNRRRKHHHHHHQPQEDIHGLLVPPRQAMLEANKKLSTTAQKSLVESTAAAVDTDAQQQKRSRGRSAKSPGRAPTPSGRNLAAGVSDDGADNEAVARDVRLRRPEKQPFSSGGRSGHNHNKSQSSQSQHAATSPSSTAVGAAQRRHASSSSDSSSSSSSSSGSSSSSSSGSSSDDDAQAGRTADQLPASTAARSERRGFSGRARTESAESRSDLAAAVAGHLSPGTPPRPREPGHGAHAAESPPRQTSLGSGETAALKRVRPMPRSRKIALGLEPQLPQEDAAACRAEPLLADPVRPPLRGSIDSILSEKQQETGDTAVGTDALSPRRSMEPPPALPLPVSQQSVFSPPTTVIEPVSLDLDADLLVHPPPPPPPAVLETKEESQQVTMDLVEKLRLQYAQQGPDDTPPTLPSPARSEPSKWRPLVSVQPEPESKPAHSVIPHLQQAERKVELTPVTTVSSLPGKPPPPSMPAITEPPKPVQPVRPDAYKCDPPASQAQDLSRSLVDKQQPPAPATPILGPPAALFHQPPISMAGLFGQQPPLMPRSAMGAVNIRSPASINAAAAQYAAFAPDMMRAMMMQSAWAADGGQQLMEQLIMQSRLQFDPQQFLMQQSAEELCRKEEVEIKRRQEEEMRRRKEEAEVERRRQEAEMQLRKEVVEERMRREEEERRRMEENERRRMEEEERRRMEEEDRRRVEEEERRRMEEEERRQMEEEERRRMEEEERRRREDEERRRREQEERRRREEEERLRQEILRREEEMRLRQEQEQQRLQALMAEQEAELRRTLLASSSAVQADKPPPAQHEPPAVDDRDQLQAPSASVQLPLASDSRLQSFVREQEVIAAEKLRVSQEQQRRQPPLQLEATKPQVEVVSEPVPEVAVDAPTSALPMSPAAAPIPAVTQKVSKKQPATEPKSDSAPPRRARGRRECSVKATEQIHKLQHESEPTDEERLPVRRGVVRQLQETAAAATTRGGRGRRGAAPGARGRSRGRGKGRGATTPRSAPFCPLPQVPNDLAGTVYDFDDEFAEEPRPLPMRPLVRPSERRASTDRSSDRAPDDRDDEQLELAELDPLLLSSVSPAAAASVSLESQPISHPPVLPSEQLLLPSTDAVPSDEPAPTATTAAAPLQSVCDQRNQLLLKIKGPFMNPSYNAQQPPLVSTLLAPAAAAVNPNLRKRKKELIRQYVNSTETESAVESSAPAPDSGAGAPPSQRLSLSCPKAVKSVSQAPTRDDYTSALHARNAATGSAVSAAQMPKRRARHSNKETATAAPTALAMTSATATAGRKETTRLTEVRPPKKRFETTTGLSVFEQIRQDNLKFGDQMLASFDDSGATTAAGHAPSSPPTSQQKKSKKKKKHKDKERKKDKHRASKVQLVNSEGAVAPRLIIKFGGRALDDSADGSDGAAPAPPPLLAQVPPLAPSSAAVTTPLHKDLVVRIEPLSLDTAAADSNKLKPLKLKFSRRATAVATSGTTTPPPPTLSPETTPRPPESCHVR